MLTILLSGLEFEGRHGASASERKSTRKFVVDVEIDMEANQGQTTDRLSDTVDFREVGEAIVTIGTGEPHRLLESLARRMIDALRAKFPTTRAIRLELRKLNPPGCPGHPAYSAVRISG